MDGKHRVRCNLRRRLRDAEAFDLLKGAAIADGNQRNAAGNATHQRARQSPADRPDALRIEHDRYAETFREPDHAKIVVEAPPAGYILQKRAATGDEQVRMTQRAQNLSNGQPRNSVDAVPLFRILRVGGNNRNIHLWVQIG